MIKKIEKIIIIILFFIIIMLVNTKVQSADKKMTMKDIMLLAQRDNSDFFKEDFSDYLGKNILTGDEKYGDFIDQKNFACIGEVASKNGAQYYKLYNIIDYDTADVQSLKTGDYKAVVGGFISRKKGNKQDIAYVRNQDAFDNIAKLVVLAYKYRGQTTQLQPNSDPGKTYMRYIIFNKRSIFVKNSKIHLNSIFAEGIKSQENQQSKYFDEKIGEETDAYVNKIKNYQFKNKTKKTTTITKKTDKNKKHTYVGPFIIRNVEGKITSATSGVEGHSVVGWSSKSVGTIKDINKDIAKIPDDQNFYIVIEGDVTTETVDIELSKTIDSFRARFMFFGCPAGGQQNYMIFKAAESNKKYTLKLNEGKNETGNLKIIKVDEEDPNYKLDNVSFLIHEKKTGQYVTLTEGKTDYVETEGDAIPFVTKLNGKNENGVIYIENLRVGEYIIYEKSTNSGYKILEDPINVTVDGAEAEIVIDNPQEFINISGTVWVDETEGKTKVANGLYETGETPVENINVSLKLRGNIVQGTQVMKTDRNGNYKFVNVPREIIKNNECYVEFEYNGFIYKNTSLQLGASNGSKAQEEGVDRNILNNNFAKVEGIGNNRVQTKTAEDHKTYEISYQGTKDHIAIPNKADVGFIVHATTRQAEYALEITVPRQQEIAGVNLGLIERRQADLAVTTDVKNIKMQVKGDKNVHIYNYDRRKIEEDKGLYEDAWDVGVRFVGQRVDNYQRPVYRADLAYKGEESDKLKVQINYQIAISNQEDLTSKIYDIVNYYDSRMDIEAVGTGLDENGNITGKIIEIDKLIKEDKGEYAKVTIPVNALIQSRTSHYIYIQFDLPRSAIESALDNDEKPLENITEIKSYTSYSDTGGTQLYAALDKDSCALNSKVNQKDTYEDDTDFAPTIKLVQATERTLQGKVFEDKNKLGSDTQINQTRQGNGIFDSGENGISNVQVQLIELANGKETPTTTIDKDGNTWLGTTKIVNRDGTITEEGKNRPNDLAEIYNAQTKQWEKAVKMVSEEEATKGEYTFSGFVPGNYVIRFIWGDGIYTVENYKGTVYTYENPNSDERYKENQKNKKWYTQDEKIRYTDAIDNYATRQKIDEEINGLKDNKGITYETYENTEDYQKAMDSLTCIMGIKMEKDDTDENNRSEVDEEKVFVVSNIDFGIIERARQSIKIDKQVKKLIVSMSDGMGADLINATVTDDRILETKPDGTPIDYVAYMAPNRANKFIGFIKAEMDNEIVQSKNMKVVYKFVVQNQSELDYASQEFYQFGKKIGSPVTITPAKMVDYLDLKMGYLPADETQSLEATLQQYSGWSLKTTLDLKGYVKEGILEKENIKKRQIYLNEVLASQELEPGDYREFYMQGAKELRVNEDSTYDNEIEIIHLKKNGGSKLDSTPGNYNPGEYATEKDTAQAEKVQVLGNTGGNKAYLIPTIIGISACIIIGIGIIFIKKKAL